MCPDCPKTGKKSFCGEKDALGWVRKASRGKKGWHPPHRAYRCRDCGYWHLTRQPLNARNYRNHYMR